MAKYYTGIGSRKTPPNILNVMQSVAQQLEQQDFVLRSGAAEGADAAFESGCLSKKQIFVPWNNFNGKQMEYKVPLEAFEIASKLHPYWVSLSNPAQKLMARNVLQILGPDLNEKSLFVVCWTPDGCTSKATRTRLTGGTGLAIALADENNIPIFNLKNEDHYNRILTYINNNILTKT
jgi:hypothetical protein